MNILVLSNCPVVEHQGSGYVIISTVKTLSDLGHQVDVIPPSTLSIKTSYWQSRAVIYKMIFGMARWVYANKKEIPKYELIILYGAESFLALFIIKKVLKLKNRVLLHSNGLELHVGHTLKHYGSHIKSKAKWYHLDLSKWFKYCYRNVDAIITVSKYDHDFAIQHLNIPSNKVYFNEPALPEIFFNYCAPKKNSKKRIITYCGTWIDRKGTTTVENAIPNILKKYPDYIFKIIGVGEKFKTEDHFPDDVLQQIEVHSIVKNKKHLIKLYSETSIFLFPSICESFGLVVAEAMFWKCAVITGPTGFAADIRNNEEAIVLQVPDAFNVLQALEKLITDDSLRNKLAVNANIRTKVMNSTNYKRQMSNIIEAVMTRP